MVFKKRINDKSFRVIFFLIAFGLLCDIQGLYYLKQHKENFRTYNLFILIEGVFLGFFFYQILYNKLIKQFLFVIGVGFISYWLYTFFTIGNRDYVNTCVTIENVCILAFAIYYYYEQIIRLNTTFIYNQPRFWVVTAYLIYIAGTFFLLLYLPIFSSKDQEKYYVLNYVFIIIRSLFLSLAIFMKNDLPTIKSNKLRVSSSISE